MSRIDFRKVDAAFPHLANDEAGRSHLAEFSAALNNLKGGLPGLNDYEVQYVASSLLNQRIGLEGRD